MKKIIPIVGAALLAAASFGSAVSAQTSGNGQSQGQQMNSTGDLPQGSLANKRDGAIGQEPRAVQQDSGDNDQAEAGTDGKLPEGSLIEKRQENKVIGDKPEAVIQGDGKNKQ